MKKKTKMTEAKKQQIKSMILAEIQEADQYYEKKIEPNLMEANDIYHSSEAFYKKMFPELSKNSNLTSSDVADTIEWCLPALMKMFFASDDVITILGQTSEDDKNAAIMQDLINYQLIKKNNFFLKAYNWFKDALIKKGILKVSWEREYNESEPLKDVFSLDAIEQMKQDKNVQILDMNPAAEGVTSYFVVTYQTRTMQKNQPLVECLMASELRHSPDAKSLREANFIAHRKVVNVDYLRRKAKEGLYTDVEQVAAKAGNIKYTQFDEQVNENLTDRQEEKETAKKKVILYECYTKTDINDDGLLEDVIITVAEDVLLRIEENTYNRHPFFDISSTIDPHKVWSKGFADAIAQIQHLRTALIRQVVTNIALTNNGRHFLNDTYVDMEDYTNGSIAVRVNAENIGQVIQPFPQQQLSPATFSFLEYIENMKENRTGITRYTQGLDANSLNKTATGITAIQNAANQRLELIARIFAETGMKDVFEFLIELNQKFIDQETVVRLTNQELQIRPDDLKGQFDLIVNAGMGTSNKQTTMNNMQQILGLYPNILQYCQQTGIPMVKPENVYNVIKKMIEEMGYKNVSEFITDPQEVMQQMQQQQAAAQQQMAQQQAMQMQGQQPMMPQGGMPIG